MPTTDRPRCASCSREIGTRCPSDDFCGEECQHRWTARNNGIVAWYSSDDGIPSSHFLGRSRWC